MAMSSRSARSSPCPPEPALHTHIKGMQHQGLFPWEKLQKIAEVVQLDCDD